MTLYTHGKHIDKKFGELFIGHFSSIHIEKFVTWDTKRSGKTVSKGKNKGKQPLFIQRNEAIDKGWNIL